MNFFVANHGKSDCDQNFGAISRFYEQVTKTKAINTTDEFMEAMQKSFEKSSLNRKTKSPPKKSYKKKSNKKRSGI